MPEECAETPQNAATTQELVKDIVLLIDCYEGEVRRDLRERATTARNLVGGLID
jgi:hypothetical protein